MTQRIRIWHSFMLLIWALSVRVEATERRALLIGIDDYSAVGLEPPALENRWPEGADVSGRSWRSLRGAVSDIEAVGAMLRGVYGVAPDHLTMLRNGEATRAGILRAIEDLIEVSQAGDHVLFYYSGHGSQVKSAVTTEADGLDETIVPADSNLGAADLRDKELRLLFHRLLDKTVVLTIVQDSCHSGSGMRGPEPRVRALETVSVPQLEKIEVGADLVQRGAVVIAASLDFQNAYETCDGEKCLGAFTRALLESLRMASKDSSVDDLMYRTRARLRLYNDLQEPTLQATAEARRRPLFGARQDRDDQGRLRVAVETVRRNGRVVLQGGWVHGLTAGSELSAPGTSTVVKVKKLLALRRAEAEIIMPEVSVDEELFGLESGTLLTLKAWAPPPGEPLRFWWPEVEYRPAVEEVARALALEASAGAFVWVEDPATEAPTHVLEARRSGWVLSGPAGEQILLGHRPIASAIASHLSPTARLFVRLPPTADVRSALLAGWPEMPKTIVRVDAPGQADYLLVGRLEDNRETIAWLHRSVFGLASGQSVLPLRSDWLPLSRAMASKDVEAGIEPSVAQLEEHALIFGRVHGWMTLLSLEDEVFPYRLKLQKQERDGSGQESPLLTSGKLEPGALYSLRLEAEMHKLRRTKMARYVYVFTIDPWGRSQLLFPRAGILENRFPVVAADKLDPPETVRLEGTSFRVVEPYGHDIFILLTTSLLIADPSILEWRGGRFRGRCADSLEALGSLERLICDPLSGWRGSQRAAIDQYWSVERLIFDSRP